MRIFCIIILLLSNISFAQQDYSIFSQYRNMPIATQPATKPVIRYQPSTPSPILIGLEKVNTGWVGVLETSTQIINIKVGDTIDWDGSSVVNLTIDEMTLSNGVVVKVGNNLQNQTIRSLPVASPYNSLDSGQSQNIPVQTGRGRGIRGRLV
jgi:hypothetical protein